MTGSRIPRSAFLLGWAGVIPFAALSLAALLDLPSPIPAGPALRAYGCTILSFMAGVQWGVAMRAAALERRWTGYAISVLPALLGWASLLIPIRLGLGLQAAAFLALLAYDLWTVRAGYAPSWYARLRRQLTIAVVLLLSLAAIGAPSPALAQAPPRALRRNAHLEQLVQPPPLLRLDNRAVDRHGPAATVQTGPVEVAVGERVSRMIASLRPPLEHRMPQRPGRDEAAVFDLDDEVRTDARRRHQLIDPA